METYNLKALVKISPKFKISPCTSNNFFPVILHWSIKFSLDHNWKNVKKINSCRGQKCNLTGLAISLAWFSRIYKEELENSVVCLVFSIRNQFPYIVIKTFLNNWTDKINDSSATELIKQISLHRLNWQNKFQFIHCTDKITNSSSTELIK